MNQLISLAVSEKLSALLTIDYLNGRARKANPKAYNKILSKVPNIDPEEYDQL